MNNLKVINRSYFMFEGQNVICFWAFDSFEDISNSIIKKDNLRKDSKEYIFNYHDIFLILDNYTFLNDADNSEIIVYKCYHNNKIFWAQSRHFTELL